MSKNLSDQKTFPIPQTEHEAEALRGPEKRYIDARLRQRIGAGVLLAAGLIVGADQLHDGDIGPVSYVAAGFAGTQISQIHRANREQTKALEEANHIVTVSQPSPSDLPPDLMQHLEK